MFIPNTSGLTKSDDVDEQRSGDRGVDGRDDEGSELVAGNVDAERARRVLAAGEAPPARGRSANGE